MKDMWKFHVFAVQVLVCALDEEFENWTEIHILPNIPY